MSITTLKPRQIISGKLGSSVAQMMVYFSALTPCLAFTYLLRGVDLPTIIVLLAYTFFFSLGLSMVGLLLATSTQNRVSQVFMSVGFIVLLLFACYLGLAGAYEAIYAGFGFRLLDSTEFWVFTGALGTFYGTTFALAFYAAAGMITFTSENRSTPLRICMLVQHPTSRVVWLDWPRVDSRQFRSPRPADPDHVRRRVLVRNGHAAYVRAPGDVAARQAPASQHQAGTRVPDVVESRPRQRLHVRGRQHDCTCHRLHIRHDRFGGERQVDGRLAGR
jgi:hypothetical protein